MQEKIQLVLPYPPTINHMYINNKKGGRVLSPKAKAWIEECLYKNKLFIGEGFGLLPIKAFIKCYPPDRRIRDGDNIVKAILDMGKRIGCYKDDRQIVSHVVHKKCNVRNGFVDVTFRVDDKAKCDKYFYYRE